MAARNDRRPDGAIAWKSEVPFVFDLGIYGTLCDRLGRLFAYYIEKAERLRAELLATKRNPKNRAAKE